MTLRIAMWSGPRNLSTAMMRSFGNRADTAVSDEPFYGAFLKTSGAPHPLAAETIAAMDCDWASVARTTDGPWAPHWYQAVEASTGFGPPEPPPADLPDEARRLVARCRPYYQRLAVHRIRAAR